MPEKPQKLNKPKAGNSDAPGRPRFERPRILSDSEANTIRGKCLVNAATTQEVFQLIDHFDLVIDKLRGALQTLAGAMPQKVFVFGAYGERFTVEEPTAELTDEYETIDFKEILGEE